MPSSDGGDKLTPRRLAALVGAAIGAIALAFMAAGWLGAVSANQALIKQITDCQGPQGNECGPETLQANIRSAQAAEDALGIAFTQLVVSVAGLVGVAFTVLYARNAWLSSQAGLEDARKDADEQAKRFGQQLAVARRHAEIAEDTAKKQLRAYLYAHALEPGWLLDGGVGFYIRLRNSGATPAINIRAGGKVIFTGPKDLPEMPATIPLGRLGFVGANITSRRYLYTEGGAKVAKTDVTLANNMHVLGKVEYEDIFGKKFETEFAFYTHLPEPGDDGMTSAPGHRAAFRQIGE